MFLNPSVPRKSGARARHVEKSDPVRTYRKGEIRFEPIFRHGGRRREEGEVILASGESLYSLEEVGGADFLLAVSQFSALRARALFRTSSSDKFENDE